jgi:hypothetical protein
MTTLRLTVHLEEKFASGVATVKVKLKEPPGEIIVVPVSWRVPQP